MIYFFFDLLEKKIYSNLNSRRSEWEKCVDEVNKHNENYKLGGASFTMGINHFSDGTRPAMGCFDIDPPVMVVCYRGPEIVLEAPYEYELIPEPILIEEVHVANDEEWEKYKTKFNKVYESEEEPSK